MYGIPKNWAIEESLVYPDIDVLTGVDVLRYCKDVKEEGQVEVNIENYNQLFFPDPAGIVYDLQDMANDVLKEDEEPCSSGLSNTARLVDYSDSSSDEEEVEPEDCNGELQVRIYFEPLLVGYVLSDCITIVSF